MKRSVIIRSTLALVAVLALAVLAGCGSGTDTVLISAGADSAGHTKQSYDFSQALCSRCHTHEGATAYIGVVNGLESADEIYSLLLGEPFVASPSNVTCGTCHDLAGGTGLLGEKAVGLPSGWSSQFKTCTVCHQLIKSDGTPNVAFHESWGGQWMADRIITDTHYDDPATSSTIEGYIVNATSSHSSLPGNSNLGTCMDCHDQHNTASVATNRQWAHSAHGGHILDTIVSATGMGNVTSSVAPGWTHSSVSLGPGSDCNRCHSATGFRNLANDPSAYDPNNDEIPLASGREMLYCWACHIDTQGTIRDPGLFNGLSPYAEPSARIDAVPDIGGSNICMACHSGRETGEGLKDPGVNGASVSFRNIEGHNLPAGAILYRTGGYEYAGLGYADVPYFLHREIGSAAHPETGSNGPCVGCHMEGSDVGHTLEVVEKDASGVITGLPANGEICSICHLGPYALTPEEVEHEAEGFRAALLALSWKLHDMAVSEGKSIFNAVGLDFSTPYTSADLDDFSYPYFGGFGASDWTTAADPTGKNNLGAAFNFTLLVHEPGAFAHNSYYTKRLIFDSINWLDDGTMGATIDLSGFTNAAAWIQRDSCDPACDTSDDNAVTRP